MDPGRCHYCKDILKYYNDDELEALVVVVRLLAAGAIVVVGGPLAAVATVAVGISSSVKSTVIVAEANRMFTDQKKIAESCRRNVSVSE